MYDGTLTYRFEYVERYVVAFQLKLHQRLIGVNRGEQCSTTDQTDLVPPQV